MALKYYGIEIEWVYNKRCIQGVRKIVTQSEGEVWQSGLCANCRFVCQFLFNILFAKALREYKSVLFVDFKFRLYMLCSCAIINTDFRICFNLLIFGVFDGLCCFFTAFATLYCFLLVFDGF
jgi:hypothetical protein